MAEKNRKELVTEAEALGLTIPNEMTKKQIQDKIDETHRNTPIPPSIFTDPEQTETQIPAPNGNELVQVETPVSKSSPRVPDPVVPTSSPMVESMDPTAMIVQNAAKVLTLSAKVMDATHKKLMEQPKVVIMVPFDERNDQPGAKLKMKINGLAIEIPKGEFVSVPKDVATQYQKHYTKVTFAARKQEDIAKTM